MTLENTLTSPSWIHVSWEGGFCTGNVDAISAGIDDVTHISTSAAADGGLLEREGDRKTGRETGREKEKEQVVASEFDYTHYTPFCAKDTSAQIKESHSSFQT